MFLPAWRNNSGSFLWCVDMEKPHFSRSKSVFLTQSTRYYSELNFAKPEENYIPYILERSLKSRLWKTPKQAIVAFKLNL